MVCDSALPLSSPFSSLLLPPTIILTHPAFTSLLPPPLKLKKRLLKWQICPNVTQTSFAPDKKEKKICMNSRWKWSMARCTQKHGFPLRKKKAKRWRWITVIAWMQDTGNNKNTIKANVIEFECPFHFCVSPLNYKMVIFSLITQLSFSSPGSLQQRDQCRVIVWPCLLCPRPWLLRASRACMG